MKPKGTHSRAGAVQRGQKAALSVLLAGSIGVAGALCVSTTHTQALAQATKQAAEQTTEQTTEQTAAQGTTQATAQNATQSATQNAAHASTSLSAATQTTTHAATPLSAATTSALKPSNVSAQNNLTSTQTYGVVAPDMAKLAEASADTSWYDASKTTFTLDSIAHLKGLAQLVNEGTTFEGKTLTLTSDLNFGGNALDCIGSSVHPFAGTFDGGSHRISNIAYNFNTPANVGMFGYVGATGAIKNINIVGGTLTITQSESGAVIQNVGSIAGYCAGTIENCSSSMAITCSSELKAQYKRAGNIREVGGIAGYIGTGANGCNFTGSLAISSPSDVVSNDGTGEYMRYIAGYIGGVFGRFGGDDKDTIDVAQTISNCTNSANVTFNISGMSDKDRFGEQTYAVSRSVGGIVGYASGNIEGCSNKGTINTSTGEVNNPDAGRGASGTGGIVGTLRGTNLYDSACAQATQETYDPAYNVWKDSNGATRPRTIKVTNCTNNAVVIGLAGVGGIAGGTGAFTEIVGCGSLSNSYVKGCRWNKPAPAGIVGSAYGNVIACYNQGYAETVTGGGFYAAGIAGFLSTYNTTTTESSIKMDLPELKGCYVTGQIICDSASYRSAALVGESSGIVHDNAYIGGICLNTDSTQRGEDGKVLCKAIDTNDGSAYNNHQIALDTLKSGAGISILNTPLHNSNISQYYISGANQTNGLPVLNWQDTLSTTDINTLNISLSNVTVTPAQYSASSDPEPGISVTVGETTLYQNADFTVVPQEGARDITTNTQNETPYFAHIIGRGAYAETLNLDIPYGITQGDMSTCTITAATSIFNFQQQDPTDVKVYDAAGNLLDSSEYTWSTSKGSADDTSIKTRTDSTGKTVQYYTDYKNVHGTTYFYDVTITGTGEHYSGTTTQACFRIDFASMMDSGTGSSATQGNQPEESVKLGDVVFGNQTWNFAEAVKDHSFVQIKYTGSEIKPTVKSVVYKGVTLRDATGKSDDDVHNPYNYDYKYIYGNPNPEQASSGDAGEHINVTGEADCMTVRYCCTSSNFRNYTNVFYTITPAEIDKDVTVSGLSDAYQRTGSQVKPNATLTYNGMTLAEGTDYTVTYGENLNGTGSVTYTGKGNYTGTLTKTFSISDDVSQVVYRMYNTVTSEHLFTTSLDEYNVLKKETENGGVGWRGEEVAWYSPKTTEVGVYRLYNPALGAMTKMSHHYTASKSEADELVANWGWVYDNNSSPIFYSAETKPGVAMSGSVPVYRLYNEGLAAHHYSTSKPENDELIANHGWNGESIGFYALTTS